MFMGKLSALALALQCVFNMLLLIERTLAEEEVAAIQIFSSETAEAAKTHGFRRIPPTETPGLVLLQRGLSFAVLSSESEPSDQQQPPPSPPSQQQEQRQQQERQQQPQQQPAWLAREGKLLTAKDHVWGGKFAPEKCPEDVLIPPGAMFRGLWKEQWHPTWPTQKFDGCFAECMITLCTTGHVWSTDAAYWKAEKTCRSACCGGPECRTTCGQLRNGDGSSKLSEIAVYGEVAPAEGVGALPGYKAWCAVDPNRGPGGFAGISDVVCLNARNWYQAWGTQVYEGCFALCVERTCLRSNLQVSNYSEVCESAFRHPPSCRDMCSKRV